MKFLVIGGAGFIGRWVVQRLLDRRFAVGILDDLSSGRSENLEAFRGAPRFLGLHIGSTTQPEALVEMVHRGPWDVVVHLGTSAGVQRSIDDPVTTFRSDVEGTLAVLESCRLQSLASRVIIVSTSLVYDAAGATGITETHSCRATSPYAAMRIGIDALAAAYHATYGLEISVIRPFNTYGPFQKSTAEGGVVAAFLKRDIEHSPILVKGSGAQTRDLLYVEDCAEILVRVALSPDAPGETFNAGTGRDISIRELAELCASPGTEVRTVPHDHPQAEIARLRADCGKAKRILGWEPEVSLEEGLSRSRAWFLANPWA